MVETDVTIIYHRLCKTYPVCLSSSLDRGFKSGIDFPVLHGHSVLGDFELFYDDISFPFYVKCEEGKVITHWHLQTLEEAEKCITDFMEGKLQLVSFGQAYNN